MATWYVIYRNSDGEVRSQGTTAAVGLPSGLTEKSYPDGRPNPREKTWDPGSLDFVNKPTESTVNLIQWFINHPMIRPMYRSSRDGPTFRASTADEKTAFRRLLRRLSGKDISETLEEPNDSGEWDYTTDD